MCLAHFLFPRLLKAAVLISRSTKGWLPMLLVRSTASYDGIYLPCLVLFFIFCCWCYHWLVSALALPLVLAAVLLGNIFFSLPAAGESAAVAAPSPFSCCRVAGDFDAYDLLDSRFVDTVVVNNASLFFSL